MVWTPTLPPNMVKLARSPWIHIISRFSLVKSQFSLSISPGRPLHCSTPHSASGGLSSFGFGGTNAHLTFAAKRTATPEPPAEAGAIAFRWAGRVGRLERWRSEENLQVGFSRRIFRTWIHFSSMEVVPVGGLNCFLLLTLYLCQRGWNCQPDLIWVGKLTSLWCQACFFPLERDRIPLPAAQDHGGKGHPLRMHHQVRILEAGRRSEWHLTSWSDRFRGLWTLKTASCSYRSCSTRWRAGDCALASFFRAWLALLKGSCSRRGSTAAVEYRYVI